MYYRSREDKVTVYVKEVGLVAFTLDLMLENARSYECPGTNDVNEFRAKLNKGLGNRPHGTKTFDWKGKITACCVAEG